MMRKIQDFFRKKTAAPPPEDPLAVKFANFFTDYAQSLPPAQGYEMVGWVEQFRVGTFQNPRSFIYEAKPELGTNYYQVFKLMTSSVDAILAQGKNSKDILWLDNHLNNKDFEKFLRHEKFLKLLPNEATQFASLLTELKLSYLGRPKLITNSSQIASSKERYEQLWSYSEAWQQKLLEDARLIEELDARIFPPRCNPAKEGYSLTFFVWTKILGRLFQVQCEINPSGAVEYSLTLLVNGIGDAFTPR